MNLSSFARVLAVSAPLLLVSTQSNAQALFSDQGTAPFEGLVHWTNYLRVVDIDGDGDLDVVFANCGGFFSSPPGSLPLLIYANDGAGNFSNVSATAIGGLSAAVRQVATGDVDGDGDIDMYVPNAGGQPDTFFINNGQGVFTNEAAARLPGVNSRAGATRFGDIDNDGDLDLIVTDGYSLGIGPTLAHVYRNNGAGVFTEDTRATPTNVPGYDPDDLDLIDIDRDFDLDILINVHAGKSVLWVNDGTGNFTDESERLAAMPGGENMMQFKNPFHYGPAVCDVDNDGDLDIWTDNVAPGYQEQLMINNGAGVFVDETAQRVSGNVGADDNGLACVDVDHDGDFDAVIMSLSNVERILLNDGAGNFSAYNGGFPSISDSTLWFDFGDLNNDGRLDSVTGQGEFGEQRNRLYFGTANAVQDGLAPHIIAQEPIGAALPDSLVTLRFAVSDAVVTDAGPRLTRAFVRVGTAEVPAVFMGGDLFRASIDTTGLTGEVTVAACAEDMAGNLGCGPDQTLLISVDATSSSSTGSAGGANGSGSVSASGAGGGGGGFGIEDEGCGCALVKPTKQHAWYWFILATAALGWVARRESSKSGR